MSQFNNIKVEMSNNTKKPKEQDDALYIVEERIIKVNGEMTIRKYAKNCFLGKVGIG